MKNKRVIRLTQAALIAAQLASFQNGSVADAELYDARCGLGAYSPLFNGITRTPYYVYMAFNVLRKLGTAVKVTGGADEPGVSTGLWACAATDGTIGPDTVLLIEVAPATPH